jgi:hypothetical protein
LEADLQESLLIKMRVRCTKITTQAGPNADPARDTTSDLIALGDDLVVLSIVVAADAHWPVTLQALHPDGEARWWPADMFETSDTTIPSNWVTQLWPDGTLHIAPEPWLRPGFWIEYSERRNELAVETFERELSVIVRDS